jgi:hypothetical protein
MEINTADKAIGRYISESAESHVAPSDVSRWETATYSVAKRANGAT